MSGLLKHWFSTDRNSAIKSISTKPIKITTRDAVIVTLLTIVATTIIMFIYFNTIGTPAADRTYGTIAAQTALTSLAAQYLYEYSGVNNMIAESSLRYAEGSTLDKYVSRREAIIYECLYKLLDSPTYKDQEENIRHNFTILRLILTNPELCGKIIDYSAMPQPDQLSRLQLRYGNENVNLLLSLPQYTINATNTISDHITEDMVYDILVYGFEDYKLSDNSLFSTLDEIPARKMKIEL